MRNYGSDGYNPAQIANYFIATAAEGDQALTPMQLLKLVYIAYAWYYTITGRLLFDERVEAWDLGPVVPSLYHEFKRFGSNGIETPATMGIESPQDEVKIVETPVIEDSPGNARLLKTLATIWKEYKNKSGRELSEITHESGSAWSRAYKKGRNNPIIPEDMVERAKQKIIEVVGRNEGRESANVNG